MAPHNWLPAVCLNYQQFAANTCGAMAAFVGDMPIFALE
jgi:hypothetical protein